MVATDETLDRSPIDAVLACLLDRFACPALVVRAGGELIHANRAAGQAGDGGFVLAGGRLRASNCRDQGKLDELLAGLCAPRASEGPIGTLALRTSGGGSPLLLQAQALPPSGPHQDAGQARVLVLIVDPKAERQSCTLGALGELGLTPSEARVAARLGAGHSPKEIADEEAVSLSTVRFHVRNIYSKLDLCRAGQLSRMVHTLSLIAPGVGAS